MARNNVIPSYFYDETNNMSSNIRPSKLLGQCKNRKADKIIMTTEILLSLNVKTVHVWNLRPEKSNSDEGKESKRCQPFHP